MFFQFFMLFALFNVVFLLLLKHRCTKWCISHGQIAFSVHFLDRASVL